MKVITLQHLCVTVLCLFLQIIHLSAEEFKLVGLFFGCDRDVTSEYHSALQDFSTRLYKAVAEKNRYHFAVSQYSVWLSLASIAEATVGIPQQELFKKLNLPKDQCLREKYYEIATSLESPGYDVTLDRKRILVLDDGLNLNTTWAREVRAAGLIDTKTANLKYNSKVSETSQEIAISSSLHRIKGNSLFLDTLNYEALWTTAFENSTQFKGDFFDDNGDKIGSIDYMKLRKRVKLAHIPLLNSKLLELPVGNGGRYRMLFIVNLAKDPIRRTIQLSSSSLIADTMPLLTESVIPLEVVLPKFIMTSVLNLKEAIADIGLESVFQDEEASRFISDPPALPSDYIQSVTIKMDSPGLQKPGQPDPFLGLTNIATGLASVVGRDFVANRPFVFGLVDSKTRTWLFSGAFSRPFPI